MSDTSPKQVATPGKKARALSLLSFQTRLIWFCVLPLVVLAMFLAVTYVYTLQTQRNEDAEHQARNVAMAIDQKIGSQMAAMQVLSSSPLLDDLQRFNEFYIVAQAFHRRFGSHIVLADTSMQMLLNTRLPLGTPLPRLPLPKGRAAAPVALETGNPAVGDVFFGPIAKEPLVAIAVPVIRNGATKLLLISVIQTSQFQERLEKVSLPSEWSLRLLDGTEEVMAHRSSPDTDNSSYSDSKRFVAKSSLTPWSVVLEIPADVYRAPLFLATFVLAAAILAVTLISISGGWRASRKLAASVRALVETRLRDVSELSIMEIEAVRRILAHTAEARELAESTLLESERRYRDLYENAPDMYVSVDATTSRVVGCNQTLSRMTGYSKEAIIGRPVLEIYHPDSREDACKAFQVFLAAGNVHNIELQLLRADGSTINVILNASAVCDENGAILISRSSLRDITDLKRAEEIILESEKNHRLLIENLDAGVVVHAPDTRILLCNRVASEMLGVSSEKMIGKTSSDEDWMYVREDGSPLPPDEYPVNRVISTLEPISNCVVGMDRPGSNDRAWGLVNAYPAINEKNELEQVVVTFVDITDRKRAEDALIQSENRFRLLYEEAPVAYQSLDEDGYLLQVNMTWLQLLGYTRSEVIGKRFSDFLNACSRDHFEEMFPEFKRAGHISGVEYRMVCRDESIIDVSVDGRIVWTEDGKFRHSHCVFQDITQRKKAERALLESEQKYRATFNTASVGIDLVAPQGTFLEVNSTLSEFLGYAPEELQCLTVFDVTHPEDIVRSKMLHEAMIQGKTEGYRLEKRFLRKDGSTLWADVSVSALRDVDGTYRATVGVISDITQRKILEEARSRLAAAVEQAAETVEITDAQGTIVYVNPSFERTTGYSLQEVVGNNPRILKSGRHDNEFYRHMWDTITHGKTWTGHLINRRKEGTLFEEDVSISPVKADSGEITNYVAVKRDVTKEVSLQRQLLQAQKMEAIGTLAGGMAHDFNNILQVVLGFSELMLAAKSKEDSDYSDLHKIHHAASSGADLVRNLLTLGRKVETKPIPMDLNNQVRTVKKLLQRTIPKMIGIKLDLAGDLMRMDADPGQIEQIIMNLAVNARDAMGEKGTLTLKTENIVLDEEYCRTYANTQPGQYVLLSVSDTGHGMGRETLQRIFEPFYTTKELGRGTGLGLSMVYGIVNQHGGHIRCESEIGLGSTFRVYFPAIKAIEESPSGETDKVLALGTETILLVDDEEFVRDLGARILRKGGYTVLTAKNGLEALDVFKKESSRISLVILDLIMPEMGGKGCLKELLKIDDKTGILVASGSSADSTIKECFELGARGFVAKPFRLRELLREVRKILDRSYTDLH
ncbi:PAS domain S-box protein [Desulfomonile tiedjei]|uniref:histidine kinase n=1 Tax=Desulfomonile tiedjei (strain ATCC 49306 / DSM 6799 / DCB-1) TaxID=706587 RepID=I4C4P0_DESTA|nr:PAS domain S-box protein [Desulfomonile tiedjei]AFM24531.1 PAS domain S-box [Desulfomonile tiedjei DSM 6799]